MVILIFFMFVVAILDLQTSFVIDTSPLLFFGGQNSCGFYNIFHVCGGHLEYLIFAKGARMA